MRGKLTIVIELDDDLNVSYAFKDEGEVKAMTVLGCLHYLTYKYNVALSKQSEDVKGEQK